jgi:hypothetical protein
MDLQATLWPSRRDKQDEAVQITVYIVTGRHGLLRIPEAFCRECHLFVHAVDEATDQIDVPVDIDVVSWWTRFPWALRHGGYHPPVLVVGDRLMAQGEDVPSVDDVVRAIREEGKKET